MPVMTTRPDTKTLFDKLWERHVVVAETERHPALIYIDLHLIHEVTSPQAFQVLRERGLSVRRADRILGTADHSVPTEYVDGKPAYLDSQTRAQVDTLVENCDEFGIELYPLGHQHQGIIHVIGPELGATQPGMTIVCGDSHTSTHGAFGAWAFGIGTTEVSHVLATQSLLQRKPRSLAIRVDGALSDGVTAKDLILAIIRKIGVDGGLGHVIEYRGPAIGRLSMDERMTVCNMSIEAGARAGLIGPDETTLDYLKSRPRVPQGHAWAQACDDWLALNSDEGAVFDQEVVVNADEVEPMVTYGTNPAMSVGIEEPIPIGDNSPATKQALQYMRLTPGQPMLGQRVDVVFIGSCTNSRIEDLRAAAGLFKRHKVASHVRALVVPGSQAVKRQAVAEGLAEIFVAAGADWREPGCSMCIGMNGDQLKPGELAVSTSNRNFEGRQGTGGRTVLASPLTAAASAIHGVVADARKLTSS